MKKDQILPVINVEIDEEGNVVKRLPKIDREGQLINTLLHRLYPDIKVARVTVPTFALDEVETEKVKDALSRFTMDGIDYHLIGAGSSAKEGTFYAVDAPHEKQIAKRFAHWPQAAITYFGILVSDCKTLITEDQARVLVVEDLELGTNDCRGWISQSLFAKLGLPQGRFYQFRLAMADIQAKGCFKVMSDETAAAAGADLIIPKSATKPKVELSLVDSLLTRVRLWHSSIHARVFQGPLVLGIRDYSKPDMEYKSSYTLIQHTTEESLEKEIIPAVREDVRRIIQTALQGDYSLLLQSIGSSNTQANPTDNEQSEFTSFETSLAEALLKVDGSGHSLQMPYVQNKLQKLLARWAFKACTAGLFKLPAFALMDDGVLFVQNNVLHWAADWIPFDAALCELASKGGLEVRFPVRKKADLLPFTRLSRVETIEQLSRHFAQSGVTLDESAVAEIVDQQLLIEGTFAMHSRKAAQNGGDFDYDCICVIPSSTFPLFVESRERMTVETRTKNKKARPKAPWWNLAEVAMEAKGNVIGWITDMTSAALAAHRWEEAEELSDHLQNALDALKHDVTVDFKRLRDIQKELPRLAWMATKRVERVEEMPHRIETVGPHDIVGRLYNAIRPDIQNLFQTVMPLHEFAGLMRGGSFTKAMFEECRAKVEEFRALCKQNRERTEQVQQQLARVQAEFDQIREHYQQKPDLTYEDRQKQRAAGRRLDRAKAAVKANEERSKTELRNFYLMIQLWAKGKTEDRRSWAKALWSIVTQSTHEKASGALFFQAFPQELLDAVIERTGGQPVRLQMADLPDGKIRYDEDGNIFLLESYVASDGSEQQKQIWLFQVSKGRIWMDGTPGERIQSFPLQAGQGTIRHGEVIFSDIS
ncbi:MAG: hypothetical protein JO185_06465, partial [Acidobacteriaceae bacterium]|nr:hypothetical protein [Acidobacteriaceae bacterium]